MVLIGKLEKHFTSIEIDGETREVQIMPHVTGTWVLNICYSKTAIVADDDYYEYRHFHFETVNHAIAFMMVNYSGVDF